MTGQPPLPSLDVLYGVSAHPRPWAWFSLTPEQADEVAAAIAAFVGHLNETYAVVEKQLVPGCWPLHPGLTHELAALYAAWAEAMQGAVASPNLAMTWHDRWLPGFYGRLPGHLGLGTDTCRPGLHREDWCPAAVKLPDAAKAPDEVLQAVRGYRANPAAIAPTE